MQTQSRGLIALLKCIIISFYVHLDVHIMKIVLAEGHMGEPALRLINIFSFACIEQNDNKVNTATLSSELSLFHCVSQL